MCKIKNPLFFKRVVISKFLWLLFWIICLSISSLSDPSVMDYLNPMFWFIIINRVLLWFFVAVVWVYDEHPIFWFRFYPILRWALVWIIVSSQLAIWFLLTNPWAWSIFAWILISWAIYWSVIDMIATKACWEWKKLFK